MHLNNFLANWTLENEAGDGSGSDGGGGGGSSAGEVAPTGGDQQAGGTVLERGAAAALPPLHERIPEKYRVVKEDGSVDIEASTTKLAAGYGELSKRFGAGDVPPADVAGYKINIPEQLQDAVKGWDTAGDEKLQAFLGEAHKSGMTQGQLDLVIGQYLNVIGTHQPVLTPQQQAEKTAQELSKVWKDDAEFDKNVGAAYKAGNVLAAKLGVPFKEFNKELGNNPMFLRLAAALAPEMTEDTPHGTDSTAGTGQDFAAQVAELRSQKDALPEKDPRRASIQEQINQLYARKYPSKQVA